MKKYIYEVSGSYTHEPSPGVYNEGSLTGSAVILDTYNEITDPANDVNDYDEWDVFEYEYNAGTYHFSGKNGLIKRYTNTNSLLMDSPTWAESEQIYIVNTGPGAVPPETMHFGEPVPAHIDLDDGTKLYFHGVSFKNRKIIDTCPPGCWFCGWICRLFGKFFK